MIANEPFDFVRVVQASEANKSRPGLSDGVASAPAVSKVTTASTATSASGNDEATSGSEASMADEARSLNQPAIFAGERNRLLARREALKTEEFENNPAEKRMPDRTFGIALSGGGIRSATISLGVLRSLGRAGLIPYVDYISSVSGGSYIASFLCSRYVPSDWRGDVEVNVRQNCAGGRDDPFAGVDGENGLNHLRQSGRHLLPGGAGDLLRLITMMVRSWFAVHLVVGITLLTLLLTLKIPQILWDTYAQDFEAKWAGNLPPALWPSAWAHGYELSHWFVGSWLLPASLPLFFVGTAMFWSYFLTRGEPKPRDGRLIRAIKGTGLIGASAVLIVALFFVILPPQSGMSIGNAGAALVAAFAAVAISSYIAAEIMDARASRAQLARDVDGASDKTLASARVQEDRVRHRLTRWSGSWVQGGLIVAALGLLDSVAQTLYMRNAEVSYPLSAGAALAVAVPIIRQILMQITTASPAASWLGRLLARFGRLVALAVGLLFAVAVGLFWATLAHRLAWFGAPVGELDRSLWFTPKISFTVTLAAFFLTTILIALSYSFINLSTFASFYASNLRRAYLGASNVRRWREGLDHANRDHVDDDVALERYYDERVLAPLHLINVTINDTASLASNVTQRDRRGKPFTISPVGYLYAENALQSDLKSIPFNKVDGRRAEKLPLSTWIGISGAAASTGMGQYGSAGLSLLAGLANLRLGYWWDPGPARGSIGLGSVGLVQGRLLDEFLGRFPGSDGVRWYLTDGGHFENTGAYELIRRRIALILVCDNGADPKYDFSDMITLARRVRIDFDAELKFIDHVAELDGLFGAGTALRRAFGTPEELGVTEYDSTAVGPYAAIGRVTYSGSSPAGIADRSTSTVIWLKPRVCGSEALDLVAYAKANKPFPQQSTLDQNFSEAQWESYYRLGLTMADRLFAPNTAGTWRPRDLKPLP